MKWEQFTTDELLLKVAEYELAIDSGQIDQWILDQIARINEVLDQRNKQEVREIIRDLFG